MAAKTKTYDEIKVKCLKKKRLFEDHEFIADDRILFYPTPTKKASEKYEWRRPKVFPVSLLFSKIIMHEDLRIGGASIAVV